MPTPTDEVRRIAEGLSPGEQRYLKSAALPQTLGTRSSLCEKGLAKQRPWRLTPLGLAVRTHLAHTNEGDSSDDA